MQIDRFLHSVADNYKLLTNLVVPPPDRMGHQPKSKWCCQSRIFSVFQRGGVNPLYIISLGLNDAGEIKDTA